MSSELVSRESTLLANRWLCSAKENEALETVDPPGSLWHEMKDMNRAWGVKGSPCAFGFI